MRHTDKEGKLLYFFRRRKNQQERKTSHAETSGSVRFRGLSMSGFLTEGAVAAEACEEAVGMGLMDVAVHFSNVMPLQSVDIGPEAAVEDVPTQHMGGFVAAPCPKMSVHDRAKCAVVAPTDVATHRDVVAAVE